MEFLATLVATGTLASTQSLAAAHLAPETGIWNKAIADAGVLLE
jgi:hypothetical protein